MTTEEFFNATEHGRCLLKDLRTNIHGLDLNPEDLESLTRLNMIVIREFAKEVKRQAIMEAADHLYGQGFAGAAAAESLQRKFIWPEGCNPATCPGHPLPDDQHIRNGLYFHRMLTNREVKNLYEKGKDQ